MASYTLRFALYLIQWITLHKKGLSEAASQSGIRGQYVELQCAYKSTDNIILWMKGNSGLSEGTIIYQHIPNELSKRLSITGNHIVGEYHLTIRNLTEADAGTYSCIPSGVGTQLATVQLWIIEGPISASIASKTSDYRLLGSEDQPMIITCTAVSEDPSPDMILEINNQTFTRNGTKTIQYATKRTDRSYNDVHVKCLAGYQRFSYFIVNDTATIYLNLKPLKPTFHPDPVVAMETRPLLVSCTSTGGRPEPTEILWSVGTTDVTWSSNTSSVHEPESDTFSVTSTLMYNITRSDDGKTITCGLKNNVTVDFITSSRVIHMLFVPDTPSNLSEVDSTESSITIQWTPGFDGGHEQTFVIEYRVTNTIGFQETVVLRANTISQHEPHIHSVTALKSGTTYEIRIFSRNIVGSGPPSKIVMISTKCSNCEISNNPLIGVAVGLSSITIISLVINGVFVFRMINGKSIPTCTKRDPLKPSLNKTSRPEVYYNIAETIEDKDAKDTIQISTYEELGSKDKPNEYEELNKSSETISNVNQACNYETLGATDQPNVYDDLEEKASSEYIYPDPSI